VKIINKLRAIKEDPKFIKKYQLTYIDDLESFNTFLNVRAFVNYPIVKVFVNKDKKDLFIYNFSDGISNIGWDKVEFVDKQILSDFVSNPFLVAAIKIDNRDFKNLKKEFLELISRDKICIVFDSIQNPWNLGGMFRNNSAFSVFCNILLSNSVNFHNPRVIRSSKGFVFEQLVLNFDYVEFSDFLSSCKFDFRAFFLENRSDSFSISQISKFLYDNKVNFIVFGNEERGIDYKTKSIFSDSLSFRIDIRTESLNVFASHSIVVYELRKFIK
jgi:tRNA G18 (ribose-2'-O)-methylase SpoU